MHINLYFSILEAVSYTHLDVYKRQHLRRELSRVKGFDVCSADTLLRMQKELATEKETIVSETDIEHDFNINLPMNRLMIKLLVPVSYTHLHVSVCRRA